jgi:CRISPR/Cas system-associated protein Cas5 (RAMP superfamily)
MEEVFEQNKEYLSKNKSRVNDVIKQWFEYENDEEIPFSTRYEYRMFLEHYYQTKFNEILEIGKGLVMLTTVCS